MNYDNNFYNDQFYNDQSNGSYESAKIITSLLLKFYKPKSVIDIGCGVGTWLKAFEENGLRKIKGIDGPWVDKSRLYIDKKNFIQADFTSSSIKINEEFDLCTSFEVAEHLPKEMATEFIRTLCNHSQVILFSAAIPNQGGTCHINEQWQSYWGEIFNKFNFKAYDIIRPYCTGNKKINWWYRQNIILYIHEDNNLGNKLKAFKKEPFELDYACREFSEIKVAEINNPSSRYLIRKIFFYIFIRKPKKILKIFLTPKPKQTT